MRRPSPALIVAFAALVVALGGTAVAAKKTKKYVVTSTKQISPKVLSQLRGRTGPMGPTGLQGAPGVNGTAGPAGADGPPGPSNVITGVRNDARIITGATMAKLTVPPGSWLVVGTFTAWATGSTPLSCAFLGGDAVDVAVGTAPVQVTVTRTIDLAAAGDVALQCPAPGSATASAKNVRVYAIRTGDLQVRSLD
jgi:hypothetical protein